MYVVAPPTTHLIRLLRVPYPLVRLYSEVDFPVAAEYLGIVETESGSPRLSRDLIRDCNLGMRLLDSTVGACAITSMRALFAVLGVQLLLLLHVHLTLLVFPIGECVSVLRSCTSGMVIVRGKGCCETGTLIPHFKDRCSAQD